MLLEQSRDTLRLIECPGLEGTTLRWRALTYSSLRATRAQEVMTVAQKKMLDGVLSIFRFAGESAESPFLREISDGKGIAPVAQAAIKLSDMIKTGIFSGYYEVNSVSPGERFNGDAMTDADGLDETSENVEGSAVMCTVELGLRQALVSNEFRVLVKPSVIIHVSRRDHPCFCIRS